MKSQKVKSGKQLKVIKQEKKVNEYNSDECYDDYNSNDTYECSVSDDNTIEDINSIEDHEDGEDYKNLEYDVDAYLKDKNFKLGFIMALQKSELKEACKDLKKDHNNLTAADMTKICKNKKYMLLSKKYMINTIYKGYGKVWLVFEDNVLEQYSDAEFSSFLGDIIYPPLWKWLLANNPKRYKQVVEPGKPAKYGNEKDGYRLNQYKNMMHKYTKGKVFDNETIKNGNVFLKYILDVCCSGNSDHADFIEKWIGNMCKHKKNGIALYLKSVQGVGKSTLSEYLLDNVLGHDATIVTGSYPLTSGFDSTLKGKTLVVFEELESYTKKEWMSISSKLKRMINGTMGEYNGKGKDPVTLKNFSNYIILSNEEAIQDANGRRYFVADVSTKHKDDKKYFDPIYDKTTVWNSKTGEYLFHYFIDKCPDDWKAHQNMPETESKRELQSRLLNPIYKYIKDIYINEGIGLKEKLSDLYSNYIDTLVNDKKPIGIQLFNSKLREVGLVCEKAGHDCKLTFNYSIDELKEIAKKEKWYSKYDEINLDFLDEKDNTEKASISKLSEAIDLKAYNDIVKERDALLAKINELTKLSESNKVTKKRVVKTVK